MISRIRSTNRAPTIADVQRAVSDVATSHQVTHSLDSDLHAATAPGAARLHRGEPEIEENIFKRSRYQASRDRIQRWLRRHLKLLQQMKYNSHVRYGIDHPKGIEIAERIATRCLGNYLAYLQRDTRIRELTTMQKYAFAHYKCELQAILALHAPRGGDLSAINEEWHKQKSILLRTFAAEG